MKLEAFLGLSLLYGCAHVRDFQQNAEFISVIEPGCDNWTVIKYEGKCWIDIEQDPRAKKLYEPWNIPEVSDFKLINVYNNYCLDGIVNEED